MVAHRPLPDGIVKLFRSITRPVTKTELYCLMWDHGFREYIEESEKLKVKSGKSAHDVTPKSTGKSIIEKCSWSDELREPSSKRHDGKVVLFKAKGETSKEEAYLVVMFLASESPATPYYITDPGWLLPKEQRAKIATKKELQEKVPLEDLFEKTIPDLWTEGVTVIPSKKAS